MMPRETREASLSGSPARAEANLVSDDTGDCSSLEQYCSETR